MHVVLIGSPEQRARLRAALPPDVVVSGEAATLSSAARVASRVDGWLLAPADDEPDDDGDDGPEPLTPRERDVLELLADGFPNKRIAARLGISDQTAKFHVASICGKLGVTNRTEAVRVALRKGLITL